MNLLGLEYLLYHTLSFIFKKIILSKIDDKMISFDNPSSLFYLNSSDLIIFDKDEIFVKKKYSVKGIYFSNLFFGD